MMQHYAISQIASFLGISTQTIRNYEKRGLIQIEKSENSYRRFQASDLTTLLFIRAYRNLGFSLDDVERLMKTSNSTVHCVLEQREQELVQQIEHLQWQLKKIGEQKKNITRCLEEGTKIRTEICPSYQGILFRENRDLKCQLEEGHILSSLVDQMPDSRQFIHISKETYYSDAQKYAVGLTIPDNFQHFDLSEDVSLATLQPCVCLTFNVYASAANDPAFRKDNSLNYIFESVGIQEYMDAHALQLIDNVWGIAIHHNVTDDAKCFVYKFFFPVLKCE